MFLLKAVFLHTLTCKVKPSFYEDKIEHFLKSEGEVTSAFFFRENTFQYKNVKSLCPTD